MRLYVAIGAIGAGAHDGAEPVLVLLALSRRGRWHRAYSNGLDRGARPHGDHAGATPPRRRGGRTRCGGRPRPCDRRGRAHQRRNEDPRTGAATSRASAPRPEPPARGPARARRRGRATTPPGATWLRTTGAATSLARANRDAQGRRRTIHRPAPLVCYATFALLRPFTLHCTRKGSVAEGQGAQQSERGAVEGEGAQQTPSGGTRARAGGISGEDDDEPTTRNTPADPGAVRLTPNRCGPGAAGAGLRNSMFLQRNPGVGTGSDRGEPLGVAVIPAAVPGRRPSLSRSGPVSMMVLGRWRPPGPASVRGCVGAAEKGGRRVSFGCATAPTNPGNGVIAPLRDGRGAGWGVKDMRRPPFWVAGPSAYRFARACGEASDAGGTNGAGRADAAPRAHRPPRPSASSRAQ